MIFTAPVSSANEYALTVFTGYRGSDSLKAELTDELVELDGASSFGLILSMKRDRVSTYDLYFSRQDTVLRAGSAGVAGSPLGLRIDYLHLGGTVDYELDGFNTFTTGGLGLARISPANVIFGTETKWSFSLGGGLKFPMTENTGLRLEGRVLGITTSGDRRILCANGQCEAQFEGSVFLQYEISAGLSITF